MTWGCSPGRASAEPAALTTVSSEAVIEETQNGLGTWRYTVAAGGPVVGPAPGSAGGRFWPVTAESARVPGGALLPQSCVFVEPDEAGLTMRDMTTDDASSASLRRRRTDNRAREL